jgi:hypothetical protein
MRSVGACALSLGLVLAAAPCRGEGAEHLERLLLGMATSAGVEAAFTERRELALLSAPLESRGRLYFVPPDRLARFTDVPAATALLIDGERVRFREGSEPELDLSGNPMTRPFVENLVVLWSGDRERLERLYRVRLSQDGSRWQLALEPRGAPLDRVIAEIRLRGEDSSLREMLVRDRDGDLTTTHFHDVASDRAFTPEELERLFVEGRPLDAAAGAR